MQRGDYWYLFIPPELAYGEHGRECPDMLIVALRWSSGKGRSWPTAAEDNNTDAKINGLTERQVSSRSRKFLMGAPGRHQDSRISVFQIFTRTTGTRGQRPRPNLRIT
jgi:hypothetical protein